MRARSGRAVVARLTAAALVVVVGLGVLSGCTLFRGGQSLAHANSSTVLPEGVQSIDFSYRTTLDGFTTNYHLAILVTVADGFDVTDDAAFLEWLLQLGWSVNDHEPTSVSVKVPFNLGGSFDWPDESAFTRLKLDPEIVIDRTVPPTLVSVPRRKIEPLFGSWPAEVPKTPEHLFAPAP